MSEENPNIEDYDSSEGQGLPTGLQFFQTSTTGFQTGRNPRTVRAAYDHDTSIMYVIFWDGTYWYYEGVDPETWSGFKSAESKGKFLHENGFNSGTYKMGPVDMDSLSAHRQAAMSANLAVARRIQEAYKGSRTSKRLYGKGHDYRLRGRGGFDR